MLGESVIDLRSALGVPQLRLLPLLAQGIEASGKLLQRLVGLNGFQLGVQGQEPLEVADELLMLALQLLGRAAEEKGATAFSHLLLGG